MKEAVKTLNDPQSKRRFRFFGTTCGSRKQIHQNAEYSFPHHGKENPLD